MTMNFSRFLVIIIGLWGHQQCLADPGNELKKQSFGGNGIDFPNKIIEAGNGNYLLVGYTTSTDAFGTPKGDWDGLILMLDASLDTLWSLRVGDTGRDAFTDVIKTGQGDFVAVGYRGINTNRQACLVKFNKEGRVHRMVTKGGDGDDEIFGIRELSDGALVVCGFTNSVEGEIHTNHIGYDGFLMKVDHTLKTVWTKSFGGNAKDYFTCLTVIKDEVYAAGISGSSNGDITGYNGARDAWMVKVDAEGNLLWSRNYGTPLEEHIIAIDHSKKKLYCGGYTRDPEKPDSLGHKTWLMVVNTKGKVTFQLDDNQFKGICFAVEGLSKGAIVGGSLYRNDSDNKHGTLVLCYPKKLKFEHIHKASEGQVMSLLTIQNRKLLQTAFVQPDPQKTQGHILVVERSLN